MVVKMKKENDELHDSHKLRCSDSSYYDLKCVYCGEHDDVPGGWGGLIKPCTGGKNAEKY